MSRLSLVTALIFLSLSIVLVYPNSAKADELIPVGQQNQSALKQVDPRSLALEAYLDYQGSPLKDYTDEIISLSDQYGLDWKLIPAIAAAESRFGENVPHGKNGTPTSYNAWGWGVYGGNSVYFPSWSDGIKTVAFGLKTQFIDNGMTNPYLMNAHYSSDPNWADNVTYYLTDLDNFQKDWLNKYIGDINSYNQNVAQINMHSELNFQILPVSGLSMPAM